MFALYSVERSVFSFDDYGALLGECRRLGADTALEFGPGVSTLALIEGGCRRVVSCEYDPVWADRAKLDFRDHPVEVLSYGNRPNVEVEGLGDEVFDIAFVDSPVGQGRRRVAQPDAPECNRLNTVMFALTRAPVVFLHDARRPGETATLERVMLAGHEVEMIETTKGIARIKRAA